MSRLGLFLIWFCRVFVLASLVFCGVALIVAHQTQKFPTGFWLLDYGSLIAIAASAILGPFALFPTRPDSRNIMRVLGTLSLEALLVCFGLCAVFFLWGTSNSQTFVPIAIITSGTLATLGWITSSILTVYSWQLTHSNAALATRKQQSLMILLGMRQSEQFQLHSARVLERFPFGAVITPEQVAELRAERDSWKYFDANGVGPKLSTWESILWLANYYEFIAVSIKNQNLDADLIRDSIRSIMIRFHDKVKAFILHEQQQNELSFVELCRLVEAWRTKP